ncbi:MAG: hypothetical protein LBJ57_05875, partial [Prevotellaceae bacterium]|nr:hypothetical protein [Prevotellaceae bacterium]
MAQKIPKPTTKQEQQKTNKATNAKAKPKAKAKPTTAPKSLAGKHPGGRPTAYKKEYADQAFRHCLLGATDKSLAELFNISESTLNKWKHEHLEFSECILRGKESADARVASALYSRAIGFTKEGCEKVFQFKGEVVRTEVKEYYPPDVSSGIFWLKNRQPGLWRDRQAVAHENP